MGTDRHSDRERPALTNTGSGEEWRRFGSRFALEGTTTTKRHHHVLVAIVVAVVITVVITIVVVWHSNKIENHYKQGTYCF